MSINDLLIILTVFYFTIDNGVRVFVGVLACSGLIRLGGKSNVGDIIVDDDYLMLLLLYLRSDIRPVMLLSVD